MRMGYLGAICANEDIGMLHKAFKTWGLIQYEETVSPAHEFPFMEVRKSYGCLIFIMGFSMLVKQNVYMGQVTKVWLSCYLVLLSFDSKTR